MTRRRAAALRRHRDEAGYVAILVALLASTVFMGMAALGVDTARWYVEVESVQRAADAAALAGVTYMPNDLTSARAAAIVAATKNGYPNSGTSTVTAATGDKPSQLLVTVTSTIPNSFGAALGVYKATISRSAVADYTAPAPMGSPCNTFGNEPPSQPLPAAQPAGSALPLNPFANCSSSPSFWAAIEGPGTDKAQGDRFMDATCSGTSNAGKTYGCSGGANSEYRKDGYFWAVHVEPTAVGTPINVQVYDPAYVNTQITCASLASQSNLSAYLNDYAQNDAKTRYGRVSDVDAARNYCPGDYIPGVSTVDPPVTSFALRHANDTFNPKASTPIDTSQCTKQFVGLSGPPTVNQLTQWTDAAKTKKNSAYNLQMAQVFHQWVPLCTFTPDVAGDYYLQVRTNVPVTGGLAVPNVNPQGTTSTSLIYTGNPNVTSSTGATTTAGVGLNAFALRAVPTSDAMKPYVAVAGNESMPILQNKDGSTATFNLIRALPGTKGQYIAFDFFDAGDGASDSKPASVKIIAPTDAGGKVASGPQRTPPDCKWSMNDGSYSSATNCSVTIKNSTNDGQVEHILIPIPTDYTCDPSTLGGCWFSVQVTFPGTVTDFTTWTANIGGDPVRLIQ